MKASEMTTGMQRAQHRTRNFQCDFNRADPPQRCKATATCRCGNRWFCDQHGVREPHEQENSLHYAPVAAPVKPEKSKVIAKRRRVMNRTESAYSEILENLMLAGDIVSWEFEGMALRWGNEESFTYSPDFVVVESVEHVSPVTVNSFPHVRLIFIEIKGSNIWKDDATRFRHARDNFPLYEFRMIQKTKAGFEQIR
jgi:hypothetical protein